MSPPADSAVPLDLFVPGRICLFGEHSDWAGGFRKTDPTIPVGKCLISGTNQGLYALVAKCDDDCLILKSTLDHGEHMEITISLEDEALLTEATCGSLWSYICGVTFQMRKVHPEIGGFVLDNYKTTLPVKKGLSSSAAVCVLTARAINLLYGLNLTKREEMEFAFLGETTTPSKCGRMDQGCAFGVKPVLMTFDGDSLEVDEEVEIGGPLHLIIVDLCAAKNTSAILSDLQNAYPEATCDVTRGVQKLLGETNHIIMDEALEALREGDAKLVGECMTRAQAEFDTYAIPASPEHLTSPLLHRLLDCTKLKEHVYGGKGVGSQGDGSAQFVAKSYADQATAIKLIEEEYGMMCLPLTLGA
jgi:galactokinase